MERSSFKEYSFLAMVSKEVQRPIKGCYNFCVCYLRMQMQTLCRAVEILITTSCSTSVKFFYRGLTEVFIASPFCDHGHEGQVERNHLS